jgi:predicted Zn-dependent protease
VPATLYREGGALRIATATGTIHWPIASLRVISRPGVLPLRLAPDEGDARLDVADRAAADVIAALLSGSTARRRTRSRAVRRLAAIVVGIVLLVAGAVAGWPFVADAIARVLPVSVEQNLGQAVDEKLFGETRRCDAEAGVAALDTLRRKLEPHAGAAMPLSVTVLDSPAVNAAAMPGGRIVIFKGLLREALSAEEVAGVLAHEMGHAAARHSLRGLMRGLGLSAIGALLGGPGGLGEYAAILATLSHTRAFEREADARAAAILAGAGIGTQGLIDFFARMEARQGDRSGVLSYVASHPPSGERRAALTPTQATAPLTLGEWQALREICAS